MWNGQSKMKEKISALLPHHHHHHINLTTSYHPFPLSFNSKTNGIIQSGNNVLEESFVDHTFDSHRPLVSKSQMDSTIDHQLINSSKWTTEWTTIVTDTNPEMTTIRPLAIDSSSMSSEASSISKYDSSWSTNQMRKYLKPLDSTSLSSSSNHLTTIATIANSFSAALSTIQRNNRSIDYVDAASPEASVVNIRDDEHYEWSNQDYQFMINLSIGGIIFTTLVLFIFLLWLCCSRNDRDQYSIRKGSHHRRNSINTSSSANSIDVIPNQKRRSNCSLYISNPNSEDSQPDLQQGSIMFQNQMTSDEKSNGIREYDVECGYILSRHNYDAIIKPEKYPNSLALVVGSNWITDSSQSSNSQSRGSQLARNLVTYCEQQQQNRRFTKIDDVENGVQSGDKKIGDLMMIQINPSSTATIYDYYDHRDGDDKSIALIWSSTDFDAINTNGDQSQAPQISSTSKLNDHDLLKSSLDKKVNFTKKRRNRMHNDSAAAIALNRSGLLLMANNNITNLNYSTRAPPDAILTYYDKISKLDRQNTQENDEISGEYMSQLDDDTDNQHSIRKKKLQNSPETSSGDSIIMNNQQPIVVYNERTAL